MNRLKDKHEEDRAPDGPGTYFCVATRSGTWYVSTLRFVDLTGARVRVRSRDVEYLNQSTPEQRTLEREFSRAQNRERKADRNWDEDE